MPFSASPSYKARFMFSINRWWRIYGRLGNIYESFSSLTFAKQSDQCWNTFAFGSITNWDRGAFEKRDHDSGNLCCMHQPPHIHPRRTITNEFRNGFDMLLMWHWLLFLPISFVVSKKCVWNSDISISRDWFVIRRGCVSAHKGWCLCCFSCQKGSISAAND